MPPHSFYDDEHHQQQQVSFDDCHHIEESMPLLNSQRQSPIVTAKESTETVTATSVNNTKKSIVTFNPIVEYRNVLHINDYTDDEFDNTWYGISEYSMMKADIRFTIHLIVTGLINDYDTLNDDDNNILYCRRGLEHRTMDGMKRRKQFRDYAFYAVMDEQQFQRDEQINEPEFIAQVYEAESYHCQSIANTIAFADEKEVSLFV